VTAFASEQMAKETVFRLQEIEKSIDQEFLTKMKSEELCGDDKEMTLNILDESQKSTKKSEFFENLLTKFQESNTDSIATVMERLSQTTSQFKKLT
jgi:hypothetical protein